MKGALISIRPQYSKKILDGEKLAELRRKIPACKPGEFLVVYESSPTMAIVGIAEIELVECRSKSCLWASIKKRVGVSRSEFYDYFEGAKRACAIHVTAVLRLKQPITLRELRRAVPIFKPPQSWCYLENLPKPIRDLIDKAAAA